MRYIGYILLLLPLNLIAQDVIFSQYTNAPALINPALSGQNETRAQVHSNYRNQWNSVTNNPYQSFFVSGDYSIKANKLFVGIALLGDRVGDAQLFSKQAALNLGVKIQISEKNVMYVGLQPAFQQRSIDLNSSVWNSQFDGKQFDQSLPSGEYFASASASNFDIGSGIALSHVNSKNQTFSIGIAAFHLLKPSYSFYKISESTPFRWSVHAQHTIALKDNKYILNPSILCVFQGAYSQYNFGTKLSFPVGIESRYTNFKKTSDIVTGLFYRLSDAVVLLVGFDLRRKFLLAFSYDVATNNFVANSKWRGCTEISFRWNISSTKTE